MKLVTYQHGAQVVAGVVVAESVCPLSAATARAGLPPRDSVREFLGAVEAEGQAPCGPALATLDEIDDLTDLRYRTRVNGVVKQDGSTSDLFFSAARTIASLTRTTTLLPGDIVSLGTLLGVGLFADPPQFLRDGDVVEVEIDGVGTLRTLIGPPSHDPVTGPVPGTASTRLLGGQR